MKRVIIVTILISTLFYSCSKDDESSENQIVGSWETLVYKLSDNPELNVYQQFEFGDDGSVIQTEVVKNESDNNVVGYRFKGIGKFDIVDDKISLVHTEIYSRDAATINDDYASLEKLAFYDGSFDYQYNFSFQNGNLFMKYICKPNENCLDVEPTKYIKITLPN